MHSKGFLNRTKVEKEGAGKHPYNYQALAPAKLVEAYAHSLESRLTALLNVKSILRKDSIKLPLLPVTIYIGGEKKDEPSDSGEKGSGSSKTKAKRKRS